MTIRQVCGLLVLLLPVWIYIALNAKTVPWRELGRTGLAVLLFCTWLAISGLLLFGCQP